MVKRLVPAVGTIVGLVALVWGWTTWRAAFEQADAFQEVTVFGADWALPISLLGLFVVFASTVFRLATSQK